MPETYQYPSGFALKYVYNARGNMHEVRRNDNNALLWRAASENERGMLCGYEHGNGVFSINLYDQYGFPYGNVALKSWTDIKQSISYNFQPSTGNLISRTDGLRGLTESFTYDPVLKSRLASWSINNVLQAQVHYDNNGNIVNKSDVNLPGGSYLYNSGNKPHAVHSVTSPTPAFRSASYPQNIEYTAFNKVNSIHPGTGGEDYEITYGTNNQRVKSYTHTWIGKTSRGLPIKTKYYLGDYEIEINHVTKKTRDLHYLSAGDGLFAILVTEGTASNLYYIHKDHLGSYNAITDATGNLVETLSFDPWGRRRNPTNWTYNNMPASFLFDRGFTGHEYLDGFGLINMNGRVYDPFLARFLSPDPFVQAPDYSQNYNRYSYCLNNPLKYTDPDGEWVHLAIGAFIGGTINWIANGAEFSWKGLGYFGVGALAGAIGAGVGAGVSAAIAGAGVTGVTGASFATGFIGTSTAMSTGFCSGFVSGAAGGFSSGFISGFGNAAIQPGNNLKAMLDAGIDYGWKGAVFGGVAGGITGGIDAKLHDRNFWTGAGKQNVVFSIDEFGRSKLIDVKDFGDEPPKNILDGFKTKISTNNSTLNSDGLIHTEIKIPKSVNGVHNYLRGNYDAGVLSFSVDKGTIHITSLNPLKSAVLSGWRYHSNPLNSVKDLFHNRLFNYPWK